MIRKGAKDHRGSQDFSKAGRTGQSEGTHKIVDLHAVFLIKNKVLKKGFLTMAKISSLHFRHLL